MLLAIAQSGFAVVRILYALNPASSAVEPTPGPVRPYPTLSPTEASEYPGIGHAAASTERPSTEIFTMSPRRTPIVCANWLLINATLSHVIFVTGSGSSCIHAKLEKRPSQTFISRKKTTSITSEALTFVVSARSAAAIAALASGALF